MSNETTTTDRDQHDLVQQLVHSVARSWSGTFDRPELVRYNHLPERLDGIVHSVLVELDGDGGVQPHRLAPKSNPELDLFAGVHSLRHAYPPNENSHTLSAEMRIFVDALWLTRNRVIGIDTATEPEDVRSVVGSFLIALCLMIEANYELVPQYYNDDGDFESDGLDVAPGLTAAFTAEWAQAEDR